VNTFLLAAVAIGLVAFLVFNRKRHAAAGAAPVAKVTSASRARGRGRARRGGTIQGYPDPVAEDPAAATAETAASRTLSPVLEPLPAAAAAPPPAEPATPAADWGFDEMIVEPGWPMPGEIAGAWPAAAPAPEPPVSAPVVAVEEPLAPDPLADDAATGEWEMTAVDAPPAPDNAPWVEDDSRQDGEPAMEAWVPGVSEVEPVVLPEPEPEAEPAPEPEPEPIAPAEPEPEPALVWADPAPAADTVAEPVAWQPEPAGEPVAQAVDEPVEALLPAWEPEPEPAPEPAAVAVADVWHPAAGADHVAEGDPAAEIDEVARDLPLAVAALTPVLAAGDALGVTPRMAAVLRALADEPRGLPGLGRALGVSRPVVADVCARLEDLDLVWRERDPDDRRRMIVVPTAKGLKLAEEAVPGLDRDAVAGALGRLSAPERAALVSAVRSLREASPH
jgi:DNA-binding MarR family transcriptional regulator